MLSTEFRSLLEYLIRLFFFLFLYPETVPWILRIQWNFWWSLLILLFLIQPGFCLRKFSLQPLDCRLPLFIRAFIACVIALSMNAWRFLIWGWRPIMTPFGPWFWFLPRDLQFCEKIWKFSIQHFFLVFQPFADQYFNLISWNQIWSLNPIVSFFQDQIVRCYERVITFIHINVKLFRFKFQGQNFVMIGPESSFVFQNFGVESFISFRCPLSESKFFNIGKQLFKILVQFILHCPKVGQCYWIPHYVE